MASKLTTLIVLFFCFSCSSLQKTDISSSVSHDQRYLILTADDFGASKNINEGIIFAVENDAITAISALTNFEESLPDLKKLSLDHPNIGIGVHLNIITGKPILDAAEIPTLVNASGEFYTVEELLPHIKDISIVDLRKELRAQVIALKERNIVLDHLSDQCGVLSFYNPFFKVITELAEEFNTPVRSPVVASKKHPDLFSNSHLNKRYRRITFKCAFANPFKSLHLLKYSKLNVMEKKAETLDQLGISHPDLLVECFWGEPTASNLIHILENLPEGTSELILHFGTYSHPESSPSGLDREYFKNRENELLTLTSEYLKEYFTHLNVTTIGYSDIPAK